jgi:cation-transporting ATPase I
VHLAGHEQLAKDLEAALGEIEGVCWAEVNAVLGRVVVTYDPPGPPLENLVEVVETVEARHGVDGQRFPKDRPDHPADIEGLRRAAVALGADVLGLGVSVFGRVLRVTPLPVELAGLVSLADQQPRVRDHLERLVGVPAVDFGLGMSSALAQAVALGPFGLVVDIGHRVHQVSELQARRAAWERLEPELSAMPAPVALPAIVPEKRPARLRQGPVERYADRTTLATLGAAGAVLGVTGSPRRSAGLLVAGLPKASRLGRETFASVVGRELARRDVLVMDQSALRRLDRIDLAVLDARALLHNPTVGSARTSGISGQEMQAVVAELFDPMRPYAVARHGQWLLGPLPVLKRLGIALPRPLVQGGDDRGTAHALGVARGAVMVAVAPLKVTIRSTGGRPGRDSQAGRVSGGDRRPAQVAGGAPASRTVGGRRFAPGPLGAGPAGQRCGCAPRLRTRGPRGAGRGRLLKSAYRRRAELCPGPPTSSAPMA